MLESPNDLIEDTEGLKKINSDKSKSNDNLIKNYLMNKGSSTSRTEDLLGSEEIFISIKKNIEAKKKRNEVLHLQKESTQTLNHNTNNNIHNLEKDLDNKSLAKSNKENGNNIITDENVNVDDLKEFNLKETKEGKIIFEYNTFNSKDSKGNNKSQFELNKNWKPLDKNFPLLYEINDSKNNGYEYIELNQMALRLVDDIDYDEYGLELKLNVNLIGESQLLIFTRCFVNKGINDSAIFDDSSRNIDMKDIFNKYTSLIKIMKEVKSNRCHITFGTYYNDALQNNKLCHKFFLKRQLIDYSEQKKEDDENSNKDDISEFNITLNDFGEEIVETRIYMNDNKKPNDISGNFFMPVNKKAKIMIFGKGTSVRLKEISGKIFDKRNENLKNLIKFETENGAPKNCECCSII